LLENGLPFLYSSEYVVEILNLIYAHLKNKDCAEIKNFCTLNAFSLARSYDRMASYWANITAVRFISMLEENFLRNVTATKNPFGTTLSNTKEKKEV